MHHRTKFHTAALILFTTLGMVFAGGCREKDDLSDPKDSGTCCQSGFTDTFSTFTLFIPNAYTPNADGLNDIFEVLSDSSLGVRHVSHFTVLSASSDTMDFIPDFWAGKNQSWDFKDKSGQYVYGSLNIHLTVIDTLNVSHQIKAPVCSFPCWKQKYTDADQCRFADMIDPGKGYVQPTAEVACP